MPATIAQSESARAPLVVVVGGGVSGLATALALEDLAAARPGPRPRVVVLELEPRVGGKVQTSHVEGYSCEWGVNGFLNKEPKTLELVQRLGLADQLLPASGAYDRRYLYTRGKLRRVHMHPLKFLFSGLLPLRAKLRLLREPWIPPRQASETSDESIADFGRRRIGLVAFQVLVDAMQTGIYAGDPEQMSVKACFPRVVEVEQQYGSLVRGMAKIAKERKRQGAPASAVPGAGPAGHLTSFQGGMQVLIDRFAEELGERVRRGAGALAVTREGGRLRVAAAGHDAPLDADAVVLACPAHAAATLTRELDAPLAALLGEVGYPPMAVVCLGYPTAQLCRPLDGFGFLVPRAEGLRLLGALWASATFPDNAPPGHELIRVMFGGARDTGVLDLDDAELIRITREELDRVQGKGGEPTFSRVFRHPLAIPQYSLGHEERLARAAGRLAAHPGLFLTGNAYRGISVNDCARNAWPVAEAVLAHLAGANRDR